MSDILNDLGSAQPAAGGNPSPAPMASDTDPTSTREAELATLRKHYPDEYVSSRFERPPVEKAPAVTREALENASGLTPTQAKAMAASLIASGVDPAKVNAALSAELGETLPGVVEDSRSEEAHDEKYLMDRPYAPEAYTQLGTAYRDAGMVATLESVGEWQNFLASAQVPVGMGESLVGQMLNDAKSYQDKTEGEKVFYNAEQRGIVSRFAGGADGLQEKGRLVGVIIQHLIDRGQGAVVSSLQQSGALNSASTFLQLANLGERLELHRTNSPDKKGR